MTRLITQKYANDKAQKIDAMHEKLLKSSSDYRDLVTAKESLEADYRYTKSFVVNAIDGDGISNDTRVYVNSTKSRFTFKDWTGTITNVKRERRVREAHLRKSFPKLGFEL